MRGRVSASCKVRCMEKLFTVKLKAMKKKNKLFRSNVEGHKGLCICTWVQPSVLGTGFFRLLRNPFKEFGGRFDTDDKGKTTIV